jgi:hypothetical protein
VPPFLKEEEKVPADLDFEIETLLAMDEQKKKDSPQKGGGLSYE